MGEIGFEGCFCTELCHHVRTPDGTTAQVDFVHEQAELAREYMADMVAGNGMG